MTSETFTFTDHQGKNIYTYKWAPESTNHKGIVQLVHGIMEHAGRYIHLARELTRNGYIVYAHDHQGHGMTDPDHLGFIDSPDGFTRMAENIYDLNKLIRNHQPGVPVVVMGHSMGAALLMRALQLFRFSPEAVIYSGMPAKPPLTIYPGLFLVSSMAKIFGEHQLSPLFFKLIFGPYQQKFNPGRTHMDWLSRDVYVVDHYLAHPFCGFICSYAMYRDLLRGLINLYRKNQFNNHPKESPVYIFGGSEDPVCRGEKGVHNLKKKLLKSGVSRVDIKLYTNGRHEVLQETNFDEVFAELIQWIDQQIKYE